MRLISCLSLRCHCEERSDAAIPRCNILLCVAFRWMVPGDSHGPNSPRNDRALLPVGTGVLDGPSAVCRFAVGLSGRPVPTKNNTAELAVLFWRPRTDSLFCGKATAVATVHRTVAKSRRKVNCRKAAREGGLGHSSPFLQEKRKGRYYLAVVPSFSWRPRTDSNRRPPA